MIKNRINTGWVERRGTDVAILQCNIMINWKKVVLSACCKYTRGAHVLAK